jgi:hypothetical protein
MDYQTNYLNTRLKQLNITASFGDDKLKILKQLETFAKIVERRAFCFYDHFHLSI